MDSVTTTGNLQESVFLFTAMIPSVSAICAAAALAHDLVREREGLSALILSGSPIIGSFDFRSRVDFVRIPWVIKLRNGDYTRLICISTLKKPSPCGRPLFAIPPRSFDPRSFHRR